MHLREPTYSQARDRFALFVCCECSHQINDSEVFSPEMLTFFFGHRLKDEIRINHDSFDYVLKIKFDKGFILKTMPPKKSEHLRGNLISEIFNLQVNFFAEIHRGET